MGVTDPLDRLEALLDQSRLRKSPTRDRGYLDVLDELPPANDPASRLMRTWFYPLFYEHFRPFALRFASGLAAPGRDDDRDRTRSALGLGVGAVVLDVACGPGNFTGYFGTVVGPDGLAIGLDASDSMLKQAVRNNSGPAAAYLRADAANLPFADGSVDAAICYAALYLINDPQAVVAEIARVVRPGGRISLLTSFQGRLPTTRVWTSITGLASGMRFFGRDELASWLQAAGMIDVQTQIHGLAQTVTATVPG
jgi:SAM-dependent methyltransferase